MPMASLPLYTAAALGVTSHITYFIRREHHKDADTIFRFYVSLSLALIVAQLTFSNTKSILEAAKSTFLVVLCYASSLFASILFYRVFLHRLKPFPGPFLAKTSKLWHVGKIAQRSDNYLQLDKLHKTYGDFVRTGPCELTIFTPEAFQKLHASGSRCTKSPWYDLLLPMVAMNSTRDRELHDKRRRVWDHGFSAKALRNYEARVTKYAQQLVASLATASSLNSSSFKHDEREGIDISLWFHFFGFDIMSDLAFGQSFGMLERGEVHFAVDLLREGIAVLGPLSPISWVYSLARCIPGAMADWEHMVGWCKEQVWWRIKTEVEMPDVMSWLIDASRRTNSIEKDRNWLEGDSLLLIIAGSDTTSTALTFLFYYLAKDPTHVVKLREEFHGIETTDHNGLKNLAYLNGVINETLRLHPPIPAALPRQTPSEGLTVGGRFIPGDVTVVAPLYTIGRLESCFEQAEEFIPERWCEKSGMVKDKSAFAPFSVGPYSCIGKHLALMELRAVVFLLVKSYDIAFAAGEDGSGLLTNSKEAFVMVPTSLRLKLSPLELK